MGKLTEDSVRMYEEDFFSLEMIGDLYGVSRQAVKKYLNNRGVDTSKRKFVLVCSECGIEFERHRAYIRNTYNPVCSVGCYHKRIHNPDYNQNRQGQRIARKTADEMLIQEGKRLGEKNVVHHENGDTSDNRPENLKVFENQSDHMKYHRGDKTKVDPVWSGVRSYSKDKQLGKKK